MTAPSPTDNNTVDEKPIDNSVLESSQWRRAAPIAGLYFFVSSLYFFVTNVLLYLLPVAVLQRETLFSNSLVVISLVSGLLVVFAVTSILRYWFYHFRLDATRVEVKQGIIKKSHLDLPFDKIQNVKIEQPFYYRLHGFATVQLETAGSVSSEAKIVAMKLERAHEFKQAVMQVMQSKTETSDEASTSNEQSLNESDEILLNTRSILDLVIHGITNNRVWIFLGAAAPFYETIADNFGLIMESIGFDIAAYLDFESLSVAVFILHVLSLVMIIMLFLVSFSVIASVFVFYKYRLSRLGDKYIRRSGLLNKQEVSMKRSRIQNAMQQQDWLDMVIDRANVKLAQNSAGVAQPNQASLNSPNKIIVPSIMRRETNAIIEDVFGYANFNQTTFTRVSRRLIIRYLIFPVLPILSLIAVSLLANSAPLTGWIVFSAIAVFMIGLSVLRWYRWGYHIDDNYILIRKGLFGKDLFIFAKGKVQQVKLAQTVFMQRYHKASVKFVLASSAHTIPYIDDTLAIALMDEALLIVERDKPAWM